MDEEYRKFLYIEYREISSYFNNAISFRFTVYGFYLIAIGIVISSETNIFKGFVTLILTAILFIMEMRNRTLSQILEDRGKDLEKKLFDEEKDNPHFFHILESKKEDRGGRFFSFRFKNRPLILEKDGKNRIVKKEDDLHEESISYVYFLFSHSFAIDISLLFAALYSVYVIVSSILKIN